VEKKNIKVLESALSRWQVLVQSVAGGSMELDKNTLAVLRGRLVRYLMRSREVIINIFFKDGKCFMHLAVLFYQRMEAANK
jgi:microspherule protein 1